MRISYEAEALNGHNFYPLYPMRSNAVYVGDALLQHSSRISWM